MGFANLSASLTLNIADFSKKMNEAMTKANKAKASLSGKVNDTGSGMLSYATNLGDKYKEAAKHLNSHNLGLKDTARIVQGIMVSQAFYQITGAITNATSALWEFNKELDYMKVTYSALFGSTKLAEDFIGVLQEHSIETIFDYQGLADASKKLLAYGIEYKNLMFIMEGLTNLGTMSGDAAALDRIALALGQIYTKGKLSAEEMRQLANAYIPITDILQDKFGLTGDDLKRVGDLNLPAADVINAIVEYANENFGSVGDAAMHTITGLQNRIVDTVKVVGASMLQPLTNTYKSFLAYISRGLENIRNAYSTGGVGGIFEFLVPDESSQQLIRQFLANVRNLMMSLVSVGVVAKQVFGSAAQVFMQLFNILAPFIVGTTNLLAGFLNQLLSTSVGATVLRTALIGAALAFVIMRVMAIKALVITAVTKAVAYLSKALVILSAIISKHPLIFLAMVLTGIYIGANKANGAIADLFDTFTGAAGGASSADMLQTIDQELNDSTDAANQFNNALEQSTDAANGLSNAISGAGKEAKKTAGLLSFDEVFKLPDNKESGAGSGIGGGLLGDLEALTQGFAGLGDSLIPDIPDFTDFINGFTDDLFGGLFDKIKEITNGAIFGGLTGALVGFAIGALITKTMAGALAGAKLGAKIGAAAGAGFAAFWPEVYASLEESIKNVASGMLAGSIVGALAGFVIGAFATKSLAGAISGAQIGAAVGATIGGVVGGIFDDTQKVLEERIGAIMAGTAEGALAGGLAGLIIGAFATKTINGALTGARIGAGIGALAGGALGGVFGDLETSISTSLTNMFSNITAASYGAFFGALAGMIIGAIVGAFAGGAVLPMASAGAKIGMAIGALGALLTDYLENSGISDALSNWFSDLFSSIGDWFENGCEDIARWWNALWDTDTWVAAWTHVTGWFGDLLTDIGNWFIELGADIKDWWNSLWIVQTWNSAWSSVSSWFSNAWTDIKTWFSGLGTDIKDWWNNLWIVQTWKSAWSSISSWFSGAWTDVKTWFTNLGGSIKSWWGSLWSTSTWTSAWTHIKGWFSGVWTDVKTWFTNTAGSIKSWWGSLWDTSTWTSAWTHLKGWFSDLWGEIKSWFGSLGKSVKGWWNAVWSWLGSSNGQENLQNYINNMSPYGPNANDPHKGITQGHAVGGIFNKEHIARFAERNKAEAIIPLENNRAMQPFVDAVSDGIVSSLAPIVATINSNTSNNLPPIYVGTLIADDRGIRELYKKFEVIQLQENDRRGIHATV